MSDITDKFQQAQLEQSEIRQRVAEAQAAADNSKIETIQPVLNVWSELGNTVLENDMTVAKAFFVIPERPQTLFCRVEGGPIFEAEVNISIEGNISVVVFIWEKGKGERRGPSDEAAQFLIRWIAEHEKVI